MHVLSTVWWINSNGSKQSKSKVLKTNFSGIYKSKFEISVDLNTAQGISVKC